MVRMTKWTGGTKKETYSVKGLHVKRVKYVAYCYLLINLRKFQVSMNNYIKLHYKVSL
jgi:hypothetical protein